MPNSAFIYRSVGYVLKLRVPHPTWRTPWATYLAIDDSFSWGSTETMLLGMAELWTCKPNCAQPLTRDLMPLYSRQCQFVIGTSMSTGCLHPIGYGLRADGEPASSIGEGSASYYAM